MTHTNEIPSISYVEQFKIPSLEQTIESYQPHITEFPGPLYLLIIQLPASETFSALLLLDDLVSAVAEEVRPVLERVLSKRPALLRFRNIDERSSLTVVYAEDTRFGLLVLPKPQRTTAARGEA